MGYKSSLEYLERADRVTVNGAQTLSKRADAFTRGAFPTAIASGSGCRVKTVDGTEMIDFICGLGALLLGHCHPLIEESVVRQLRSGHLVSLPHVLEAEVSEKFCAAIGQDMVRWVSTGSEACTGAMRIARAATGRDIIVTSDQSYHGWHDVFAASRPVHPGIPEAMTKLITTFKYNDLDDLRNVLDRHHENVACVIMEPCLHEAPKPGFLAGVRALTLERGIVFIVDEMIMGLRMAIGGGSAYYDIKPDMLTFGKSIGGGLPLGCIVGKREYMQHSWFISGTFSGNPLSLAACNAVLDIYQSEKVCEKLWALGYRFQHGFNDLAHVMDLDNQVACDGFAVKPRIKFTAPARQVLELKDMPSPAETQRLRDLENQLCMSLFLQETALRGVLWHPAGGNISAAMTEGDIDSALMAMGEALGVVKTAVETGVWSVLQGQPIQTGFSVRKG